MWFAQDALAEQLTDCRVCKSEWVAWYCWQAQNHCRCAWFAQDVFAEQLTVGFVNLNGLPGIAGRVALKWLLEADFELFWARVAE